ncbi:MAG: hypothetical protein KDC26_11010 [Armatimonadetes bacterium]|nr:hypothetical protein [Armatimonadota bacterium]
MRLSGEYLFNTSEAIYERESKENFFVRYVSNGKFSERVFLGSYNLFTVHHSRHPRNFAFSTFGGDYEAPYLYVSTSKSQRPERIPISSTTFAYVRQVFDNGDCLGSSWQYEGEADGIHEYYWKEVIGNASIIRKNGKIEPLLSKNQKDSFPKYMGSAAEAKLEGVGYLVSINKLGELVDGEYQTHFDYYILNGDKLTPLVELMKLDPKSRLYVAAVSVKNKWIVVQSADTDEKLFTGKHYEYYLVQY